MRAGLAVLGVAAVLAVGGCGPAEPPQPPVLIEQWQVPAKIHWADDLKGRLVSIDGFIGLDNGQGGRAIAIGQRLYSQPDGEGEQLVRFDLQRGDGPNQVNLPVLRTENIPGMPGAPGIQTVDIGQATFQDAAGVAHSLRTRVRVTGRLTYPGPANAAAEEDASSPTGKRFKPMLTDVVLEAAPE